MSKKHEVKEFIEHVEKLFNEILFFTNEMEGGWQDKRDRILAAGTPTDRAFLEEFVSWFETEEQQHD